MNFNKLSVYLRRFVIGKMEFDPITNSYYDLIDGQLLATMTTEVKSAFEDLHTVELEKDKTLVVTTITNDSWSDETKAKGAFFIFLTW